MNKLHKAHVFVLAFLMYLFLPLNGVSYVGELSRPSNINNCTLAPPASVWAEGIGPTWIDIEWTPVAGAVEYQVHVVDLTTNMVVGTYVTSSNNYSLTGLTPGHEYEISVSASACIGGPYGESTQLRVQTFIIIGDIIIQNSCPVNLNPNTNYQQSGTAMQIQIPNQKTILHFLAEDPLAPGVIIDFFVEMDPGSLRYFKAYVDPANGHSLQITPNGSELELYDQQPPPQGPNLLLTFTNIRTSATFTGFDVDIATDLVINYAVCDLDTGGGLDRSIISAGPKAERIITTPNPARQSTILQLPDSDGGKRSLQLFDSQGKLVKTLNIGSETLYELHLDGFENGLYFILFEDKQRRLHTKLIIAK